MASANGTTNPTCQPAASGRRERGWVQDGTSQLYDVLIAWVEKGVAPEPDRYLHRRDDDLPVAKSRPICAYPKKGKPMSAATSTLLQVTCALEDQAAVVRTTTTNWVRPSQHDNAGSRAI